MAESMSPASRTPRLDMRGPVGLACLAKPDLLHMDLDRPAAARELLYVTRYGQTVRYIAPDICIRSGPRLAIRGHQNCKWGGWGSNPRPADYESPTGRRG